MARVRAGKRAVLMVVDVQVGVINQNFNGPDVIATIAGLVERARAQGVPVIWVQHDDEELIRGTPEWQWVPELQPVAGDIRIYKHYNSGFEETPLESELAALGATHIVLAGAVTNWCIRATAYGALTLGYDLTLAADAHWAHDLEFEDGYRIPAESLVRDLNLAVQYLGYPGCRNAAVPADKIDFAG
jgi:nicotinamidase-related amidase